MAEILRIGFAGLGEAATRVLPQISRLPYIKLAAAADIRESARKAFQEEFHGAAYDSIEEMCQSRDVDAVYVGTPHELHAKHALIALENRKHVIVEKPMALSIEDCEKMNAAAEKYGIKLLCGHTKSFNASIKKMREIVKSGELGRLCMINTWNYNDFMVRPYPDHELAMSRGVVLNQGPHQVDIVRQIGGGMVRSVRGMAGRWDASRPGEGAHVCYLEFEDGVPATIVYSGYGFFDTSELHGWLGEGGQPRHPDTNVHARRSYQKICGPDKGRILEGAKEQLRYGRGQSGGDELTHGWEMSGYKSNAETERPGQPFFGPMIVTCERGEMRQSQKGILIYGDEKREIQLGKALAGRQAEITELYEAVIHDRPVFHDGRWGEATLEVCLAILESAKERREILLSHQAPVVD